MLSINITIGANTAKFQEAITNLQQTVSSAAEKISDSFKSVDKAIDGARIHWEKFAAVSTAIRNTGRIVQELGSWLRTPLEQFSRFEDAATRLAPLVGGLENAKELCAQLRDEAAIGTMSFEQLASVAGRLATVFSDASEIRTWATAFHDLAAGTGLDVNELVGNFVKSRASGRFEAGLMDMFAQKGVNIFPELVKQTGAAEKELREMATKGELSFAEVEKAILALATGTGQFAGQAAAMSNTFSGSVGTMIAHWHILLAEFAKPIADTLSPMLRGLTETITENRSRAESLGSAVVFLSKCLIPAAGILTGVKAAMIALNAAMAMNPFVLAAAGIATVVATIAALIPETKSLTEMVAESDRRWAESLREVKRAYDELGSRDALKSRVELDERSLEDAKAAFREAHPDFNVREAEVAQWRLEHAERDGNRLINLARGDDIKRWREQTAALLEYKALLNRGDELKALRETAEARLDAVEAQKAQVQVSKEAAEAAEKAAEAFRKLRAEQAKKADEKELDAASVRDRPEVFLRQTGFADDDHLNEYILHKESELQWNVSYGTATEEQTAELRGLIEAREKLEKLKAEEAEATRKRDAAVEAYERRKALLDAELAGNRELVRTLELQNKARELAAQYEAAGMGADEAAERADEITRRENALEEAKAAGRGGNAVGAGMVGTAQASVGGGRSISIGMSGAISVAREQLSVSRQMMSALNRIVANTERPGASAIALLA